MGFPISTIGTDSGLVWEQNLNAALTAIDSHNHSPGFGQQIQPNGININADLAFNSNNATLLRAVRFNPQVSPIPNTGSDVGELYVSGNELYYNDVTGGHQVQLTSGGTVNATSSGIASGTATAAFSASVLLVKSSSTSFANIAAQSILLSNSGNLTNQLTLQAPTLSSSYSLTLPSIPATQSFMTVDASGNMAAYESVSQGIQRTNLVSVGQQISSSSGLFTTTSATPVAVTNLSVTITTSGRPVMVFLQSDGNGTSTFSQIGASTNSSGNDEFGAGFRIFRGSTVISLQDINVYAPSTGTQFKVIAMPPSSVLVLDTPSAGTYTYTLQANSISGISTATALVTRCVLVAYEL